MDTRLGAQVWIEPDDDPERIDLLVGRAAAVGLGRLRVFLMWPWIEPEPGVWDFGPFDAVFDAAARHGVGIKATLTSTSPPHHVGTPSVLHTNTATLESGHRPAMRRYVEACVSRYRDHPALHQWILWNEPYRPRILPGEDGYFRGDEATQRWRAVLAGRYGDVDALNARWRTRLASFDEAPWPEHLPHPAHRPSVWESYAPWIDEAAARAEYLVHELTWIGGIVRGLDPATPTCANPANLLDNHAVAGYDVAAVTGTVDVMGASFHAPWHFAFAPPQRHLGLMLAGTGFLAASRPGRPVEVTEAQIGNTYYSGLAPVGASPAKVAATYLAPVLAGAESVCGWAFNGRSQDFEVGDWGLLDDTDDESPRSDAVRRVAGVLDDLDAAIGPWTPRAVDAWALVSRESQAVEMLDTRLMPPLVGRSADDAVRSAASLVVELGRAGLAASLAPVDALAGPGVPRLIVATHLTAWDDALGSRLADLAAAGHTVVVDATSGHKDPDARLHRPWPGRLAGAVGLRSRGLLTDPGGHELRLGDVVVGSSPLAVADVVIDDPAWRADPSLRLAADGGPALWIRPFGDGTLGVFAGRLGLAVQHADHPHLLVTSVLRAVGADTLGLGVRALDPTTLVLEATGERGSAHGVFAPELADRSGRPIALDLAAGTYTDLWAGRSHTVGADRRLGLLAPDGIAVLVARA